MGTSLKLYDDPDNQFVAGFLGSSKMNFLQGTVEGQNLRLSTYGDQTIALDNLAEKLNDGDNITAGIRPEHFKRGGDAVLNVTAELIEHLGGETYAYARHKGGDMLTVATDDRRELTAGSELKAHYENKDVLFFDIRGQRLR